VWSLFGDFFAVTKKDNFQSQNKFLCDDHSLGRWYSFVSYGESPSRDKASTAQQDNSACDTSFSMLFRSALVVALCLLLSATMPIEVLGWSAPSPPRSVGMSSKLLDGTSPSAALLASRRELLRLSLAPVLATVLLPQSSEAKDLKGEYLQGTAALAEVDSAAPVPREAYKKLPSGVIYADLRPGKGPTVGDGSKVNIQWVLRRSNGYFVDSSAVQDSVPFIFSPGDGRSIVGLDQGIRGVKEGGVRRILIPLSLAYVDGLEDDKPGPLPAGFGPRQQMRRVQVRKDVPGEYVFLEVQVTRVR
jgi:hypothetical protein